MFHIILTLYFFGDFNIDLSNIHHPLHAKLSKVLQTFCLSQVVNGSTHVASLGKESLIDPALVSSTNQVAVVPPLATSDRHGIEDNR